MYEIVQLYQTLSCPMIVWNRGSVLILSVIEPHNLNIIIIAPAVHLANMLACSGSKNPVKILKGGYERFSAEYPFLRTHKIMYTPLVSIVLFCDN